MAIFRKAILGLMIASSIAPAATAETLAETAAKRFPQPVRVGDLLNRQVLRPLESQPSLGRVRAVVTRPSGALEIAMDYGGFLGFFTRPIAVPIEAMALSGPYMFMLGFSPDELDKLPDLTTSDSTPLPADAIIHMGLAKPAH